MISLTQFLQLKRQRSSDPEGSTPPDQKSPNIGAFSAIGTSPPSLATPAFGSLGNIPGLGSGGASISALGSLGKSLPEDNFVGSPLKKQRAGPLDGLSPQQPGLSSSASGSLQHTGTSASTLSANQGVKIEEDEEEL